MTLKLRADYHAWWYSEWSGPQMRRYEVQCYVTGNEEGHFIVATIHQSGLPVEVNMFMVRISIPLFEHARHQLLPHIHVPRHGRGEEVNWQIDGTSL